MGSSRNEGFGPDQCLRLSFRVDGAGRVFRTWFVLKSGVCSTEISSLIDDELVTYSLCLAVVIYHWRWGYQAD